MRAALHTNHTHTCPRLSQHMDYLVTFEKGDRMKASPSGEEDDDVLAADVDPLFEMDVV